MACVYVFIACTGFGMVFGLRGKKLFAASIGAALTQMVYLLCTGVGGWSLFTATIAGAVTVALYAEILARVMHAPATVFLVVSFLPLVPGSRIFYAIRYGIAGDNEAFVATGVEALKISFAIVAGIVITSSLFRLISRGRTKEKTDQESTQN